MANTLGSKGQIVIEKQIREVLGLEAGYVAVQKVVDGHVELHFYPPEHNRSLLGILAPYVREELREQDWAGSRDRVWAEAVTKTWTEYLADENAAAQPKGQP